MNHYRAKDLAQRYGVEISTIWRWAANDQIPKPYKLSPRVTVWLNSDIREFENQVIGQQKPGDSSIWMNC